MTVLRAPRYSDRAMRTFELAFGPWRRRRLHTAPLHGLPATLPGGVPLLLVANHSSWWDGFLLRDVHRALRPGAPLHTIMTARELSRLPLFHHIGALPVEPGSGTSTLRLVRTLAQLRDRHADVTVSLFPQGRITPAWARPLGFRRGVELIARALAPCVILPVGIHIEPLNRAAPTAIVAAGPLLHVRNGEASAAALEQLVARQLDGIARLLASHGEAATTHLQEIA